jgi:hypothetical protein
MAFLRELLLVILAVAFSVSGLILGRATYKVAKDRDWVAVTIGVGPTGICIAGAAGLIYLLLL